MLEQIGHADGGKPCGHNPAFGAVTAIVLFNTKLPYYILIEILCDEVFPTQSIPTITAAAQLKMFTSFPLLKS